MSVTTKTLIVENGHIHLQGYSVLPAQARHDIQTVLTTFGLCPAFLDAHHDTLTIPQIVATGTVKTNLAPILGKLLKPISRKKLAIEIAAKKFAPRSYPIRLDFLDVNRRANEIADLIETRHEEVIRLLLQYETCEVAIDETARTLDLLRNLQENAEFFQRQVGPVTSFLPRNQPLYALACFGIVPALMAKEVHVRPPMVMSHFFFDLVRTLDLLCGLSNLHFSRKQREVFVKERAALRPEKFTGRTVPVSDVVIFTGNMANANRVRRAFHRSVLFIANGPGHNPIVVTETADVDKAVASATRVQLYNQGQDCANPNAILVHVQRYDEFVSKLRNAVRAVKVGPYENRDNRVGPITNRNDLQSIQTIFVDNSDWLDHTTEGVIRTRSAIVEPTIILKPLAAGADYMERFAPIFFVQRYGGDEELSQYFDHSRYAMNAMYITVFGHSHYVERLVGRPNRRGQVLHDASTIIRDSDLHAPGVERGTQPYGGYGRGASSISIHGVVTPKPTLPQRDIYEQLIVPAMIAESMFTNANGENAPNGCWFPASGDTPRTSGDDI